MHRTRREFLQVIAAGSAAMGSARGLGQGMESGKRTALDAARKQAAWRRRRIVYNNDGDDIYVEGADTVEKFLAVRHKPLLGTQVDSIYYSTAQSFNLFVHETRVAEMVRSQELRQPLANNLPTFLKQKTDPLRMSCGFAKEHGMESIWSLRMNDIHDAFQPHFVSQWKKDDPRRVMSSLPETQDLKDRRRLWSLVDFEHPDVEPQLVAIVGEVLRNYPVDGVELDFMRAPFYFRTAYEGKPVTDMQVAVLTRLVTNIRTMLLAESERQGKPFLLAARVPVTTELCRHVGIDIAGWLKAGLIDVMALGGGYVTFDQPITALIQLGHRHDVPVYPSLSQSGLWYHPPRSKGLEAQPPAAWRGAAACGWDLGADGIYTFNLFFGDPAAPSDYAAGILKTIGSKDTLQAADRLFAISDAGWWLPSQYWAKEAEEFSGALPVFMSHQAPTTVALTVAAPLAAPGTQVRTELRLDFAGLEESQRPAVAFNSDPLSPAQGAELVGEVRRFRYSVTTARIRPGRNEIRVEALPGQVKLAGAELWVTMGT